MREKVGLICFVGWSKSGKTRLLESLIVEARKRDIKVAAIKHTHKALDKDGKDTHRLKLSGAEPVILSGKDGFMVISDKESSLDELVRKFADDVDLVFVEGFKGSSYPKIEVYSHGTPIYISDPNVLAVVSETKIDSPIPSFRPEDAEKILDFILQKLSLSP